MLVAVTLWAVLTVAVVLADRHTRRSRILHPNPNQGDMSNGNQEEADPDRAR